MSDERKFEINLPDDATDAEMDAAVDAEIDKMIVGDVGDVLGDIGK